MQRLFKLLILLLFVIGGSTWMYFQNAELYFSGFAYLLAILTLLWLVSLALKDASIIDIFWGTGFILLAAFYTMLSQQPMQARTFLGVVLVGIWGARLSFYLWKRNWGKGEDYRYQVFRAEGGKHFWWISYFRVFILQGWLTWVVAAPVGYLLLMAPPTPLHWGDAVIVVVWLVGFVFETWGDWQLTRFKANPANQGKVLNTGFWRLTRHPNYFGDAVQWWALYALAWQAGGGWYFFSPLLMTFLLMEVSGVVLLEKSLVTNKPQYADYIAETPAFFPYKIKLWFPQKK